MSKIYKNQTALRLNFSCSADITGYSSALVNVQYPGASTATWTATVSDASTGAIYYDVATTTSLKSAGVYRFQPEINFSGGTSAKAETAERIIYDDFG
jgi:hypothetical protein